MCALLASLIWNGFKDCDVCNMWYHISYNVWRMALIMIIEMISSAAHLFKIFGLLLLLEINVVSYRFILWAVYFKWKIHFSRLQRSTNMPMEGIIYDRSVVWCVPKTLTMHSTRNRLTDPNSKIITKIALNVFLFSLLPVECFRLITQDFLKLLLINQQFHLFSFGKHKPAVEHWAHVFKMHLRFLIFNFISS